jgi:uncharacterized protein (UPF0276 family)
MKFAMNYSPQAAELLKQGIIDIDYFKSTPSVGTIVLTDLPNLIKEAKKYKEVICHFGISTHHTHSEILKKDWIQHQLDTSATFHVNTHLNAEIDIYDVNDIPSNKINMVTMMVDHITMLQSWFGKDRVIAENLPYAPIHDSVAKLATEPDVICEVIEQTDCGFLFDIDHARVRCFTTGENVKEYINKLPMHRMKEFHMTGTVDNLSHREMQDPDWLYFEWVLQNIADKNWPEPKLFTHEYGGVGGVFEQYCDPSAMKKNTSKFCELMKKYGLRD